MFWKLLTSTLIYSWYIFQGWCFISIRPLILFCTTSWVQNFEKAFGKFSTVSNGLWLRKGFARHHPVMIGDAKLLILHRRTQVKRPGMHFSPGWKIQIMVKTYCLSVKNMCIHYINLWKKVGLKIWVGPRDQGPKLLALGSSRSGSNLPILR